MSSSDSESDFSEPLILKIRKPISSEENIRLDDCSQLLCSTSSSNIQNGLQMESVSLF